MSKEKMINLDTEVVESDESSESRESSTDDSDEEMALTMLATPQAVMACEQTGKIETTVHEETYVEWKIANTLTATSYESPRFIIGSTSWFFKLCPKWARESDFMRLHLMCKEQKDYAVEYKLSLKLPNDIVEVLASGLLRDKHMCSDPVFIKWSTVLKQNYDKETPSCTVTIMCTLKQEIASSVQLTETDVSSLSEDFKQMLLNGLNHDVILKVGDKELKAHQDVLRTRSQVFRSMLSHDMKEKNSGTINIPDCDPQAMEQFLCFIYSGHVDSFQESNMLNLYYISDKYEVKKLKEKCRAFIKKSLSNSNVCEIIQLALNHSDSSLLDHATQYFMDNALDIICTVEWQFFMKDNCTVANELTIKALKKLKNENL